MRGIYVNSCVSSCVWMSDKRELRKVCTIREEGRPTKEGENSALKTDEERQPCCLPSSLVQEHCEDLRDIAMRCHIHKRYQNGKEAKHMNDQDQAFELRQQTRYDCVNDHSHQDDGPEK